MSVGETVSKAKTWCEDARKILKLGSVFSSEGRAMSSRASDIAKELEKLEKAVKSGKIDLAPVEVQDYVSQFSTMALALKEAALAQDEEAVTLQSKRLEVLKRELAVRLAKSGKKQDKAQTSFDSALAENFANEKRVAEGHLNELRNYPGNEHIEQEITAIQEDQIDAAQNCHDVGNHEGARDVLLMVPSKCEAAKRIADQAVEVHEQLETAEEKLANINKPPHNGVIADEIESIQQDKIEISKDLIHRRNFTLATQTLGEVDGLCKAAQVIVNQHVEYLSKLKTAEERVGGLENPDDFIKDDIAKIKTDKIEAAKTAAKLPGRDYVTAESRLGEVEAECVKAEQVVAEYKSHKLALGIAEGKLRAINQPPANACIAVEIGAIQKDKIEAAETAAGKRNWSGASTLLGQVEGACNAAKLISDKYALYLVKLKEVEDKVNGLASPDNVIDTELSTIKTTQIGEAKKLAAHTVRNYPDAGKLLDEALVEYLNAKTTAENYEAYKLSKTAAEGAMNLLKAHTDKDLVAKETKTAQTDLLDKADAEAVGKNWVEAKKLYDQATTTCNDLKALAQKIGTGNFKNYKTWALDMYTPLTRHAQKTEFATEIGRIEKRLEVVRAAFLKGLDNMGSTEIGKLYWECDGTKKQMDLHQTYVTKKTNDYTPKKNLLPAKTDGDFGTQIDDIEKQLASADRAAGRRVYDSAIRHLDAAIAGCVTVKKLAEERTAYQSDLGPVELAVGRLPGDGDPVIGNEAQAVRALLAGAKSLATAKEFKAAKARLPEVQTACDAANLIATNQSGAQNQRDLAVGQSVPSDALAEVRKLYEKLKLHPQHEAIDKQLKEIDKKLVAANTALTT